MFQVLSKFLTALQARTCFYYIFLSDFTDSFDAFAWLNLMSPWFFCPFLRINSFAMKFSNWEFPAVIFLFLCFFCFFFWFFLNFLCFSLHFAFFGFVCILATFSQPKSAWFDLGSEIQFESIQLNICCVLANFTHFHYDFH